jgi:hypothetical protein
MLHRGKSVKDRILPGRCVQGRVILSDNRGADCEIRIEKRGACNMAGFEVKTDLEKVIIDLLRVDTVLDGGRNLERDLAGT